MSKSKSIPIKPKASVAGLELSQLIKLELVRKFQRMEGNPECYGSIYNTVCGQFECLWHSKCLARTQGRTTRRRL